MALIYKILNLSYPIYHLELQALPVKLVCQCRSYRKVLERYTSKRPGKRFTTKISELRSISGIKEYEQKIGKEQVKVVVSMV